MIDGKPASSGVESMAELGGTTSLKGEIEAAGTDHLSVLEGTTNSIDPTASESFTAVALTTDHPRVTLLTMVAPSPDWFVGVSGLSMLDSLGGWRPSRTVTLHPFDAGTEAGTGFSLDNDDTDPPEFIASLVGKGKFSAEPIATLTFTRTSVTSAPSAPTGLSATPGDASVTLAWTTGADGGNAITRHQVRYRTGAAYPPTWTDIPDSAAGGTNAGGFTVTDLTNGVSHSFQVRALNTVGVGPAATSGAATPMPAVVPNAVPVFDSPSTFTAAENQTTAGTVQASDGDADDSVTGYAITGGADGSAFSIGATSGVLTFNAAPNYEAPSDTGANNTYVVEVQASSGAGERVKTATQTITVTVTDVSGEAPSAPSAPTVTAASATSLSVSWSAPANAGPPITDYDHRHRTSPDGSWTEVTVTTSTALSATIAGLAEGTSYDVQVRATNDEGTGDWSDSGTESTDANAAPSFDSSATFSAAENQTVAGTVRASDSDTGDDITGYAITGGADQTFFSIGTMSGVLTFNAAPNYEAPSDTDTNGSYVVVVQATSGAGTRVRTATQTITVTVTDAGGEAPSAPSAPTVTAASATSLSVNWSAPANAGPAITDYDVQYRAGTSGAWNVWTHNGAATRTTITGLAEDTSHQVQVRATNDEGTGGWSASGSGSTLANAAPSFDSSATFSAAENQTVAGTVRASDDDTGDNITGYEITGGADQTFFSIGVTSGALTFDAAPNFEDAKDQNTNNQYVVEVTATSGAGERVKTATQAITVTVTDVGGETPGKPEPPNVSAESVTSLNVSWSAPANAGPAITDYDHRHRTTSPEGSWTAVTGTTSTALSATITGLADGTSYDVQVRATNDEGTGDWSDSGTDSTDANAAPVFSSSATFDAAENQTTAGTVEASDSDTGDDITGYEITGGADQTFFSIGRRPGR